MYTEAAFVTVNQMFFKIGVLKNFHNILRNTPLLESLLNKAAGLYLRWSFWKYLAAFSSVPLSREHHAYDKNNAGYVNAGSFPQ